MTTKDVEKITGTARNAAQRLIVAIKRRFDKRRADRITVEEFCKYTGLSLELVIRVMG